MGHPVGTVTGNLVQVCMLVNVCVTKMLREEKHEQQSIVVRKDIALQESEQEGCLISCLVKEKPTS